VEEDKEQPIGGQPEKGGTGIGGEGAKKKINRDGAKKGGRGKKTGSPGVL